MIRIRPSRDRGHFNHGWLETYHSFSFGDYHDPKHSGFRSLRVLNEDHVAPGMGFGRHGHRDMEIITLVLKGALLHQDSLESSSVLTPGKVQRMTAGTGILHSEVNASATDPVHLIQIWIVPDRKGYAPEYEEVDFDFNLAKGRFQVIACQAVSEGTVRVHQDVTLSLARLEGRESLRHDLTPGRHAWVQVIRGSISLGDQPLQAGDGAALSDESAVLLQGVGEPAEVLLFDLA